MDTEEQEIPVVKIGKKSYWLFPDGRMRGVIQGGATDDDDEDEDEEESEDDEEEEDETRGKGKKAKPKLITPRQMRAIAAKEKRDGRRAGQLQLAKELGFDSVEEMKEAIASRDGEDEEDEEEQPPAKSKSKGKEATPAKRAAPTRNKDKERADQLQMELDKTKFENKVERLLLSEDALPSKASKAVALLDIEVDADDDEILEAIDKLRDELPELFHSTDSDDDDDEEPAHEQRARARQRQRKATDAKGTRRTTDSDTGSRRKRPRPAPPKESARKRLLDRHPEFANNKS